MTQLQRIRFGSGDGAAHADCDQMCAAIKQMVDARGSTFAPFRGKQDFGSTTWSTTLSPPGMNCAITDFDAEPQRGFAAYTEMSCAMLGTPTIDYTDAQAEKTFAAIAHAVQAAEPGFVLLKVTKFDSPEFHQPGLPASVAATAQMADEAGDIELYIGPSQGSYFINLRLTHAIGESVEISIRSDTMDTSYPLAPYTPQ